jgi:hypothetical protein
MAQSSDASNWTAALTSGLQLATSDRVLRALSMASLVSKTLRAVSASPSLRVSRKRSAVEKPLSDG